MDKRAKILIADDSILCIKIIESALLPLGYEVLSVGNGKECIEFVNKIEPDLILMDVIMPEMDGIEAVRVLKASDATKIIPIVMATTLNSVNARVKALEAGADDFLTKPIEVNELIARVKSLLKIKAYNDDIRDQQRILENAVQMRTKQLEKTLEQVRISSQETILRLSKASEYRDDSTGQHIHRVSEYAVALSKGLNIGSKYIQMIYSAASMHDIGKIGIPDSILLKKGKFEPEEWEIMKTHTIIGSKILENSKIDFIKMAQMIALTHHEKWDGSGYPQGLKGNHIPIAGRIVAIADVFDALTTKRSYKEAFSLEKSFDIIIKDSGKHFDPEIVEVFLKHKEEIIEIKQRYSIEEQNSEQFIQRLEEVLR